MIVHNNYRESCYLSDEAESLPSTGGIHTERVEVVQPIILELQCSWAGDPDGSPNVTGFWSQDGNEIEDSRLTVLREDEHYNLQRT